MGNKGHISVNRWHISITSRSKHPSKDTSKNIFRIRVPPYAATVYWYLAPGGDPYPPVPVSERIGYWEPIQQYEVQGAIEGEK